MFTPTAYWSSYEMLQNHEIVSRLVCEPITPYRLAIFILFRSIDYGNRKHAYDVSQRAALSVILHDLIKAIDLSFREFFARIHKPLDFIDRNILKYFFERVRIHRDQVEIFIRRDILLQSKRDDRELFFYESGSLGIFVRQLYLLYRVTSAGLLIMQEHWNRWIDEADSFIGFDWSTDDHCYHLNTNEDTNGAALVQPIDEMLAIRALIQKSYLKRRTGEVNLSNLNKQEDKTTTRNESEATRDLSQHPVFQVRIPPELLEAEPFLKLSCNQIRRFIDQQLHLLHVSPGEALSAEQIQKFCVKVLIDYPHIQIPHLLSAMNDMRRCDSFGAEYSLRTYFDKTTMRLNHKPDRFSQPLIVSDLCGLRYSPLLHAHLYDLFNNRSHAIRLLQDSVQHSRFIQDGNCTRMALAEMISLNSYPKELSYQTSYEISAVDQRDAHSLYLLVFAIVLNKVKEKKTTGQLLEYDLDALNIRSSDFLTFLKSTALRKICENPKSTVLCLQQCACANFGVDRDSLARTLRETARILIAGLKLSKGYVGDCANDCNLLLQFNCGDGLCRNHNTEAQAIAGVYVAYCYALKGQFVTALEVVERLRIRFPADDNWLCAKHWVRCEALIKFDYLFFLGDIYAAQRLITDLKDIAPEEAPIRNAVLLHAKGDYSKALDVIRAGKEKLTSDSDLSVKVRVRIVLALLYAINGLTHVSRKILEKWRKVVEEEEAENLNAIIVRRLAYIDAAEKRKSDSLKKLSSCEWLIRTRCGYLETGLFHMSVFEAYNCAFESGDAATMLDSLGAARHYFRLASSPALEKTALAEAANLYNRLNDIERRDECASEFQKIDRKYPGKILWTVL